MISSREMALFDALKKQAQERESSSGNPPGLSDELRKQRETEEKYAQLQELEHRLLDELVEINLSGEEFQEDAIANLERRLSKVQSTLKFLKQRLDREESSSSRGVGSDVRGNFRVAGKPLPKLEEKEDDDLFALLKKQADQGIIPPANPSADSKLTLINTDQVWEIGLFDFHIAAPGVELLQTPKNWSGGELEVKEIIQKVKENHRVPVRNLESNHFESYSSTSSRDDEESSRLLLSKEECQILKDFLDQKFFEWESEEQCDEGSARKGDFQITIEEEELSTLIGEQTTRKLITFFKGPFTEIRLRRVNSHGKCINFHLDMSLRTMQVPLNSDQVIFFIYFVDCDLSQISRCVYVLIFFFDSFLTLFFPQIPGI